MNNQENVIAISSGESTAADRREGHNRRRHSWATVTYCGLNGRGRRRQLRRKGEDYYLDWYDPKLVFTGLGVLLLSCIDALFTLSLLTKGAYEANYFMAVLLEVSDVLFIVTKVTITAFGVIFLLMHSNFHILRITNGRRMLQFLVPLYGLLIVYELFLLGMLQ